MNKRISAFALSLLMLLSTVVMSGCQSSKNVRVNEDLPVLTLYSITDEKTTPEAIKRVEKEINRITEYEFGVDIDLKLYTADEYRDILEKDLEEAMKAKIKRDEALERKKDETTTARTAAPDDGAEEAEGEDAAETEEEIIETDDKFVDILLVNSLDMYRSLVKNEYIQNLDEGLAGSFKSITKFVANDLQKAVIYLESSYGVANNRAIGEFEYMLLNRDLVDKYYYDPDSIHTLSDLKVFIDDMAANEPSYTPVVDTYGISPLSVSMTNDASLYGAYVGWAPGPDTGAIPKCLLSNNKYTAELDYINTLKTSGQLVEGEIKDDTKAAVVLVKGSMALSELYSEDYYPVVYKYPQANNENVFNAVYAVGTPTRSFTKSMEIIKFLQTNAEFRNVFQYGVKDKDFEIDDDNFVTIKKDDYIMDPVYTGNQFLLYQNDKMTDEELLLSANNWELGKKHNRAVIDSPYMKFSPSTEDVYFDDEDSMDNCKYSTDEILAELGKLSGEYRMKLEQYPTAGAGMTYLEYISKLAKEFESNEYYKMAQNRKFFESPYAIYISWYKITYGSKDTNA